MSDACWNIIGVRGDGSCLELERYVHCRNCPVYAQGALAVLDGDAAAADLRPIHSLPHRRSDVMLGLANVRGELLVCVSLGQVLGLEQPAEANREIRRGAHPRLLVIRHDNVRSACPVDEVHGVHRVRSREMKDVPTTVARATATYSKAILSWKGVSVGLLDDELLCYTLQRSVA